jgi:lipopolysaccharide/colanic/teichoic acid biosynthesis glycosyltransferase
MQRVALRTLDIALAAAGLLLFSPVIVAAMLCIWSQDGFSPFYVAKRVGRYGRPFNMVKLRSMVKYADKSGVASTSSDDARITWIGHIIRRYKIDELTQLWNVVKGEMSLVGPRPNVLDAVAAYTNEERRLLTVAPGVTDISSIVFSDEGEILRGAQDPDLLYDQIIRPWKSRLGLYYVEQQSCSMNLRLIWLTALAIVSKPAALRGVCNILSRGNADDLLIAVARRDAPLYPFPPPGASEIIARVPV